MQFSVFFIPMSIINLAAGQISIKHGAKGPNIAPVSACATGTHAIGDAFRMIQRGDADVVISGGCESTICPLGIGGFSGMKLPRNFCLKPAVIAFRLTSENS